MFGKDQESRDIPRSLLPSVDPVNEGVQYCSIPSVLL